MMLPFDKYHDDFTRASIVYRDLWLDLPEQLKKMLPSSLSLILSNHWVWAPDSHVLLITEQGQKKIEMLLSPHAEALLKAYAIQISAKSSCQQ